jgi:AcrR family transcriptional regulator
MMNEIIRQAPMSTPVLDRSEPDTRSRIVEAAARLFRDVGYRKTTVADIAKVLKMSSANVYRFFDSKKAINEAVAEQDMGEVESALEAISSGRGSAAERLRAVLAALYHMSAERYTASLKMHEMVEVAMTESWDVVHRHIGRVHALIEDLIADGVASGEFAVADAGLAAYCVQTAMVRFFHPQLIEQCANEPAPTLDDMTAFVLAALGHRATRT